MVPLRSRVTLVLRPLLPAVAAVALAGCGTLGYYGHLLQGQTKLLADAEPIDLVIEDPRTDDEVRERLQQLDGLVAFGVDRLGLRDTGSYRTYVDVTGEALVWSVVAAPKDSLQARQWCFPIVGCTSYRGYFDQQLALAYAASLDAAVWDVAVLPVPAYSTLGWFDDPLPGNVVGWPITDFAGLIFHEMAHATLYIPDDSDLNEAFATAVEIFGVCLWLDGDAANALKQGWHKRNERRQDFLALLQRARQALSALYERETDAARLLDEKAAVFAQLQADYRLQKADWGGYAGYDAWFDRPLNNAHLVAVSTYYRLLPAMQALLRDTNFDFREFRERVADLGEASSEVRIAELDRLTLSGSGIDGYGCDVR